MHSKSGDIIEPLLKPQWWVDCKDMASEAMKAVTDKKLEILPKASEKEWFRWLSNTNDWCISRQLWWGHRVPAYLVKVEGEPYDVFLFYITSRHQMETVGFPVALMKKQKKRLRKSILERKSSLSRIQMF